MRKFVAYPHTSDSLIHANPVNKCALASINGTNHVDVTSVSESVKERDQLTNTKTLCFDRESIEHKLNQSSLKIAERADVNIPFLMRQRERVFAEDWQDPKIPWPG